MVKFFSKCFLFLFIFILVLSIFSVSFFYSSIPVNSDEYFEQLVLSNDGFFWPLSGYYYISSYFGKRESPTSGASTYHSGIDIPASNGTNIYAIESGTITFASWGAGGRVYHCVKVR